VAQPEFVALGLPVCSRPCARWLSKKLISRPELERKVKQYCEDVQELQEGRQRVTPEVTKALREKVCASFHGQLIDERPVGIYAIIWYRAQHYSI
jgi:hypothetical protein